MNPNPEERPTIEEIKKHNWMKGPVSSKKELKEQNEIFNNLQKVIE